MRGYNHFMVSGLTRNRKNVRGISVMTEFTEIKAPTIRELFEKQLRDRIFSGELKPGDRIPTERELAKQMKISKSIVHLGITRLESEGFLKIVPRKGITVADYARTGDIRTLNALLSYNGGKMDRKTMRSMVDLRDAMEEKAMRLLAESHTDEDILVLRRDEEALRKAADGGTTDEAAEAIFQYHLDLYIRSGNTIFPMILNSFREVSLILWKKSVELFRAENTLEMVRAYTDLIERGDGEGAAELFSRNCAEFLRITAETVDAGHRPD